MATQEPSRPNYLDDPRASHFAPDLSPLSILKENPVALGAISFLVGLRIGSGEWKELQKSSLKLIAGVAEVLATSAIESFQASLGQANLRQPATPDHAKTRHSRHGQRERRAHGRHGKSAGA